MAHNLCGVQYAGSYMYTVCAYISCEIVAITVICCIHHAGSNISAQTTAEQ